MITVARLDGDLLLRLTERYNNSSVFWKDIQFVSDNSYDKLVVLTYLHEQTLSESYNEEYAYLDKMV